ncbi:hypothetical protein H9L13_03605 [Sphingomonas lutea]|uniref:DUF3617 family protein n=1 Tax=Sphingomonas lutea TaxID=1045317 RepID=A0A7G9SJI5_9SPHN|nr:hypothetical protein [Sphingomonas lutea]QNN68010.1 hypothetical protein H9L13_03605 [Sphingomonas lutea]
MKMKLLAPIAGVTVAISAAAFAQGQTPPASTTVAPGGGLSREEAQKTLENCGSRRFVASAEYQEEGKARRTGVTLCAAPGDTEEMWIGKLEKSATALATQTRIPASARTQLVADIQKEVARLRSAQRRSLPAADALVANVPAMPAPLPPRPVAPVGSYVAPSLVAAPSITIRCLNEGGPRDRGEDCEGQIRRETILALESGENMTAPAMVRFIRKGQVREEVRIGTLRQGQLVRMRLPRSVCKGVVRSELQLEVVAASSKPSAALTEGPYDLRC